MSNVFESKTAIEVNYMKWIPLFPKRKSKSIFATDSKTNEFVLYCFCTDSIKGRPNPSAFFVYSITTATQVKIFSPV